jgi:hypothetical protein
MLWHLHQIKKYQYKGMGDITTWRANKIMKVENAFYHHTIVKHGLPRCFLKT